MIIKKYSSFDIGRALLISDILITVAGCFVFDIKTGLYSFLGLAVRSFMIDNFIESFNLSKYFNVVCDDPQPICDFIVNELNRSATVVDAQGAFTGNEKYIIFTALNRPQAIKLRNYIKGESANSIYLDIEYKLRLSVRDFIVCKVKRTTPARHDLSRGGSLL